MDEHMKKILICGDSFSVPDAPHGTMWVDLLARHHNICNLATVAASNLMISMQVDQALQADPDFIIVNFTTCTRSEKRVGEQLIPFSYHTAGPDTTPFNADQLRILNEYFREFFDLPTAVYQNAMIIEHTLQRLESSGIAFRFDQGGFEHANFSQSQQGYFQKFNAYRSRYNLWDFAHTRSLRPYYHVQDAKVHHQVAKYYEECISAGT